MSDTFKVTFAEGSPKRDWSTVSADYFSLEGEHPNVFVNFKLKNGQTVRSIRVRYIDEIERQSPEYKVEWTGKDEFLSALKPKRFVVIANHSVSPDNQLLVVNLDSKVVVATYDANRIDSAHAWAKKMNAEWSK